MLARRGTAWCTASPARHRVRTDRPPWELLGPRLRTSSTAAMASRSSVDPLGLVLGHQAHAPGQRLAAAAGHAGVDQRVEHPAVAHAQPGHDRHARRREEDRGAAAHGAPRHRAPEGGLGLVGDAHPGARLSSRNPLMRACSATRTSSSPAPSGSWGGARVPTTWISSPSMSMRRAVLEPGVGHPPGEPGPDQPLLLGPRRGWRWPSAASPAGPSGPRSCLQSYYEIT